MLAGTSSGLKPATCRQRALKTDKTKSFVARPYPSLPLRRMLFSSSFYSCECGPLSRAEVYGNCYSGRRRSVLVTLRAKCRLAVDVGTPGHTPAHIYDFSPHVNIGIENRWTLCAIPSSHDTNIEGYLRGSVLFGS